MSQRHRRLRRANAPKGEPPRARLARAAREARAKMLADTRNARAAQQKLAKIRHKAETDRMLRNTNDLRELAEALRGAPPHPGTGPRTTLPRARTRP